VYTLLLDDALKPAMQLTNGVSNKMLQQFAPLSGISQSSVATHLRFGGILLYYCKFPPYSDSETISESS